MSLAPGPHVQICAGSASRRRVDGAPLHLCDSLQAAAWAAELASLCGQRADPRTGLEAEAYLAWMAGVREMERARDWQAAVASLQRSKCVWCRLKRFAVVASLPVACLAQCTPQLHTSSLRMDDAHTRCLSVPFSCFAYMSLA